MLDNSVYLPQAVNTSHPESSRSNDSKYDIIKFFLSLMVLAIHSVLYPMILYPWLRIAVPIFFMISSKFIFSKLYNVSEATQATILNKFIIRNLRLYLCWFVILLPIIVYTRKDQYFSADFFTNALTILKSILFGSTFVASWFIMATITGVLIIYFLSKLLRKDFFVFLFSFFAFCIVTLASSYSCVISDTFISSAINSYTKIFDGLICSFPAALFWIFIGKLFTEHNMPLKSLSLWALLVLFSSIALFIEWKFVISLDGSHNNDSYFMLAPLCFLLFLGIENIQPIYWKNSFYFKRASTIIYVVHGSLLSIVSKAISMFFNVRIPALSFILTLIGCIVIYVLLEITLKRCRNAHVCKILKMLF